MDGSTTVIYNSWKEAEEELGITLVNNTILGDEDIPKAYAYNLRSEGISQHVHCYATYNGIPTLALALVLLLIPLVLLVLSCLMRHSQATVLWINAGISLALMAIAFYFISTITLPSSLLPAYQVFDWNHYSLLFSEIGTALKQLDLLDTFSMLEDTGNSAIWTVFFGVAIAALLTCLSFLLQKKICGD